ncbi:MAG: hypothetical protein NZM04_02840 [Methylacidiphilales bacterium]|nr:hypothetical protein [Candidatus Methylacidiphilales bacterium]MDW8348669.1 hypothetical protein [Verrucomicrobiae bacterium]
MNLIKALFLAVFTLFSSGSKALIAQTVAFPVQELIFYPHKNWQTIPTTSNRILAHWLIPQLPEPPPKRSPLKAQTALLTPPTIARPSDSNPLELIIYYFGPSRPEDVGLNLKAWQELVISPLAPAPSQQIPPISSVAGLKAHSIQLLGTLKMASPIISTPPMLLPNYQLLGVIVEKPSGNLYLRLIGPIQAVDRFKKIWQQFLSSARINQPAKRPPRVG